MAQRGKRFAQSTVSPEQVTAATARSRYLSELGAFEGGKKRIQDSAQFFATISGWSLQLVATFLSGEFQPSSEQLTNLSRWLLANAEKIRDTGREWMLKKEALSIAESDLVLQSITLITELAPVEAELADLPDPDKEQSQSPDSNEFVNVSSTISWARLAAIEACFCVSRRGAGLPIIYNSSLATDYFLEVVAAKTRSGVMTGWQLRYRPQVLKASSIKSLGAAFGLNNRALIKELEGEKAIEIGSTDLSCFCR